MMARLSTLFDPLVRLLLIAIVAASVLPVSGEGRAIARTASDIAIFALFFLNGLRLPRDQVLGGLRNVRFLLPLAVFVFVVMGLAGSVVAGLAADVLPASIVLGFVFLGVLPSTVQSATAYTSIAKGNVANSVIAAAGLNILGVFITAPLFALLADSALVELDLASLQRIATILLLPFALGQLLHGRFGPMVLNNRKLIGAMDRFAIALAVYVAFSGAVEQGLWSMLDLPDWGVFACLIAIMLLIGFAGAWWLARWLGLPREDGIAFLFSGAQKSIAMGAPMASILFPPATAGLVLLPILIYHLVQMVISAPLAARFSRQS